MRRVYFDSHVYDRLIRPVSRSPYEKLVALVRARQSEVYGSLATLEELGGVAGKDTSRYRDLIDCFWSCVRTNVLRDRALLLQAELHKSNRLSMRQACFDKHFIHSKIRPGSRDKQRMHSIASEVLRKKEHEAEDMNRSFKELEPKIHNVIEERRQDEQGTASHYREWLKSVSTNEIQDWLDTVRNRQGASAVSWQRAPCASALIGWIIARAKMSLRGGKQYERSAGHDRDHFIFAAQAGTLVTNDQGLAKTMALVQAPLADVETADAFFDWVLATP